MLKSSRKPLLSAPNAIPASQLQHGDVLLYEHLSHQSFITAGIRLITGSNFTHTATVQDVGFAKIVLEQLTPEREYSLINFYAPDDFVEIHVTRPKFKVPPVNISLINHAGYGWWDIADCLINHAMGRLTLGHWMKRPMLGKDIADIDCGGLNALALQLTENTDWCHYAKVIEPDDFFNHEESFEYLGKIDWSK